MNGKVASNLTIADKKYAIVQKPNRYSFGITVEIFKSFIFQYFKTFTRDVATINFKTSKNHGLF